MQAWGSKHRNKESLSISLAPYLYNSSFVVNSAFSKNFSEHLNLKLQLIMKMTAFIYASMRKEIINEITAFFFTINFISRDETYIFFNIYIHTIFWFVKSSVIECLISGWVFSIGLDSNKKLVSKLMCNDNFLSIKLLGHCNEL